MIQLRSARGYLAVLFTVVFGLAAGCGGNARTALAQKPPVDKAPAAKDELAAPAMSMVNPQRTGFFDTKGVRELHGLLWKYQAPRGITVNPIAGYGMVFCGCWCGPAEPGVLFALDIKTGKEVWKREMGNLTGNSSPALWDGKVFIGDHPVTENDKKILGIDTGMMRAFDARTGKELWTFTVEGQASGIATSPAIVDGVLYFVSHEPAIAYALDARTGKEVWHYKLPEPENPQKHGPWVKSSPTFADGVMYFGRYDQYIYAVDMKTGALVRRYDTGPRVDVTDEATGKTEKVYKGRQVISSVIPYKGALYFGCVQEDGMVQCVDIKTGLRRWMVQTDPPVRKNPDGSWAISGRILSSPAMAYGKLYVTDYNGQVTAVDIEKQQIAWKFNTPPVQAGAVIVPKTMMRGSATVADGLVYVGAGDGNLYALDAETGKQVWCFEARGPLAPDIPLNDLMSTLYAKAIYTAPLVKDGVVYFGANDGWFYAVH